MAFQLIDIIAVSLFMTGPQEGDGRILHHHYHHHGHPPSLDSLFPATCSAGLLYQPLPAQGLGTEGQILVYVTPNLTMAAMFPPGSSWPGSLEQQASPSSHHIHSGYQIHLPGSRFDPSLLFPLSQGLSPKSRQAPPPPTPSSLRLPLVKAATCPASLLPTALSHILGFHIFLPYCPVLV